MCIVILSQTLYLKDANIIWEGAKREKLVSKCLELFEICGLFAAPQ